MKYLHKLHSQKRVTHLYKIVITKPRTLQTPQTSFEIFIHLWKLFKENKFSK